MSESSRDLTEHQKRALQYLAAIPGAAPGLVRCREMGEPAAKALVGRGFAKRWTHEHVSKTRRGAGYRLSMCRVERIQITEAGRAAALQKAGVLP